MTFMRAGRRSRASTAVRKTRNSLRVNLRTRVLVVHRLERVEAHVHPKTPPPRHPGSVFLSRLPRRGRHLGEEAAPPLCISEIAKPGGPPLEARVTRQRLGEIEEEADALLFAAVAR